MKHLLKCKKGLLYDSFACTNSYFKKDAGLPLKDFEKHPDKCPKCKKSYNFKKQKNANS